MVSVLFYSTYHLINIVVLLSNTFPFLLFYLLKTMSFLLQVEYLFSPHEYANNVFHFSFFFIICVSQTRFHLLKG